MSDNPMHTPKERGNRLKEARKLAKLTIKEMTSNNTLNLNTLGGWEMGRHGGLTERGVIKVCERLAQENVRCSPEWLLYNEGEPPHLIVNTVPPEITSLKDFLPEQIKYFQKSYPNFLGLVINDDAMNPTYRYGDYVSGVPMPNSQLRLATGKNIIAKLETGRVVCRMLLADPVARTFSLVANNPSHAEAFLHNIKIAEWSLILCHFRNETL